MDKIHQKKTIYDFCNRSVLIQFKFYLIHHVYYLFQTIIHQYEKNNSNYNSDNISINFC